ncbi:hypothetical protein RHGRI_005444 [Rhododendron griersonianum]|uniref:Uncharacterized protein n=1 Tax=Rhododendron griersonianum TaxID=479676 RepID=A0AAV6LDB2_9ERIC|nr:hypothetical protein RHGRI_005444 [Rhododendron griersonianum]
MEKPTKSRKRGGKAKEGGNAEENVADATRRSWNQKEEDALLNAMKEMVVKGEPTVNIESQEDVDSDGNFEEEEDIKVEEKGEPTEEIASLKPSARVKLNHPEAQVIGKVTDPMKTRKQVRDETDNNAQGLRFKSFPYYDDWCMIFGNDRATGEMAGSAADMVENLDEAAKEGGADSTTVNNTDKSPEE